ncbi:MAG: hypothetical protein WCK59_03860 [Candidatus Falkowbacteria bacterium]
MPILDAKYLPKAKGKSKKVKTKKILPVTSYPLLSKRPETKPLKKKSPFGDHYVWSK